jgi:hypothetical protein
MMAYVLEVVVYVLSFQVQLSISEDQMTRGKQTFLMRPSAAKVRHFSLYGHPRAVAVYLPKSDRDCHCSYAMEVVMVEHKGCYCAVYMLLLHS